MCKCMDDMTIPDAYQPRPRETCADVFYAPETMRHFVSDIFIACLALCRIEHEGTRTTHTALKLVAKFST